MQAVAEDGVAVLGAVVKYPLTAVQGSVLEIKVDLLPCEDDYILWLCCFCRECGRANAVNHEILRSEIFRINEPFVQHLEVLHPVSVKGIGPDGRFLAVLKWSDDFPVLAVKLHEVRLHSDGNRVFTVVLIVEVDETVLPDCRSLYSMDRRD